MKRATTSTPQTQTNLKRRKYIAADSSSDSYNVVLSNKFPKLRTKAKDIIDTTTFDYCPDKIASTDSQKETDRPSTPDDMVLTTEELHTTSSIVVDTKKVSADQDTQEPGSLRKSVIQYGHYT